MEQPAKIASPRGKLGVLMAGMGAVSTTFMAGVELIRIGRAKPIGSLTQLGTVRLGKRTEGRSPLIREFVALGDLKDLIFAGWDALADNSYEAAAKAGVLNGGDLQAVKLFLTKIKPMPAAFDRDYVKRLDGNHLKKGNCADRMDHGKSANAAKASCLFWTGCRLSLQRRSDLSESRSRRGKQRNKRETGGVAIIDAT